MSRSVIVRTSDLLIGPTALAARPNTARLMLEVISTWSLIDHYVGMMFCCLLNGEESEAFDIFHSFFDLGPRKRAFFVVANKKLPDKELLSDLNKFFSSLRTKSTMRNRIAHGLWGASVECPEEILLIEGQAFNSQFMLQIRRAQSGLTLEEFNAEKYRNMTFEAFKDQEFSQDISSLAELSRVTASLAQRMIPHVLRKMS